MSSCTLKFRDGTEQRMEDRGAPGGSYSQTVTYQGSFVVVTDAYGRIRAFPAELVLEVIVDSERRW